MLEELYLPLIRVTMSEYGERKYRISTLNNSAIHLMLSSDISGYSFLGSSCVFSGKSVLNKLF